MARSVYNQAVFLRLTQTGEVAISTATASTPKDAQFQPNEADALFAQAAKLGKPLARNSFWLAEIELDRGVKSYSAPMASSYEAKSSRLVFGQFGQPQLQCFLTERPERKGAQRQPAQVITRDDLKADAAQAFIQGATAQPGAIKRK